jgi:hypothetical protein
MNKPFKEFLRKFDQLEIPKKEYVFIASATLAIRDIREAQDLDILVTKKVFKNLKKRYKNKIKKEPYERIEIDELEIGYDWRGDEEKVKDWIQNAENVSGYQCMKLKDVIKLKKELGREKDKKDIKLIEDYLKQKN